MIETDPTDALGRPSARGKVMVVDDDAEVASLVEQLLDSEGYEVRSVTDARRALAEFADFGPDLLILDVLMPSIDGVSLCLQLRQETDVPIMFLSAKSEPPDRVLGLRIGADDYLSKPFDGDELCARVGALLRRSSGGLGPASDRRHVRFGDLVIDLASLQAIVGERPLSLTPTEFRLLRTLALQPGRVFTRDDLLTGVWDYKPGSDTRLVDVHVGRLRKKLLEAGVSDVAIETARGFGYRLTAGASWRRRP